MKSFLSGNSPSSPKLSIFGASSGSRSFSFGSFGSANSSRKASVVESSSNSRLGSRKGSRIFSNDSLEDADVRLPREASLSGDVPPELAPVLKLLNAHSTRKYISGICLVLEDQGGSNCRQWREVNCILVGNQMALSNTKQSSMKDVNQYLNLTDAEISANCDDLVTEDNETLKNILSISTTYQNRYLFKFADVENFRLWFAAIYLSLYEYVALQKAYTGAFLSSRGSKLSDISHILQNKKDNYKDWVSVRLGPGLPWRRCYAIISQLPVKTSSALSKKKKASYEFGRIMLYEDSKSTKRSNLIYTITGAKAVYAVYPSSPLLIDSSTILKLDNVSLEQHNDTSEISEGLSLSLMPEKHNGVPGYDTIVRSLIPILNAFKLYGRPKGLIADRNDPESLLFALPNPPHIYYLELEDVLPLASGEDALAWKMHDWSNQIRHVLEGKTAMGYDGCGDDSNKDMDSMKSPTESLVEVFNENLRKPSLTSTGSTSPKISYTKNVDASLQKNYLDAPYQFKVNLNTDGGSGLISEVGVSPSTKNQRSPLRISSTSSVKLDSLDSKQNRDKSSAIGKLLENNRGDDDGRFDEPLNPAKQDKEVKECSADDFIKSKVNGKGYYESYVGSSVAKTFEINDIRNYENSMNSSSSVQSTSDVLTRESEPNNLAEYKTPTYDPFPEYSTVKQKDPSALQNKFFDGPFDMRQSANNLESDYHLSVNLDAAAKLSRINTKDDASVNVFEPDYFEQTQMLDSGMKSLMVENGNGKNYESFSDLDQRSKSGDDLHWKKINNSELAPQKPYLGKRTSRPYVPLSPITQRGGNLYGSDKQNLASNVSSSSLASALPLGNSAPSKPSIHTSELAKPLDTNDGKKQSHPYLQMAHKSDI